MNNSIIEQLKNKKNEIETIMSYPFSIENVNKLKVCFNEFKIFLSGLELSEPDLYEPEFEDLAYTIRNMYLNFYIYDESLTAIKILESNDVAEFKSVNTSLADEEINAMRLSQDTQLCFIGSGPYPWSAIKFSRTYSCKITAIENRPEAVVLSNELISKFGLSEYIKLVCTNANDYKYNQFSIILVAAMVTPKKNLISKIYNEMAPGSKMIVRSAIGKYRLIYDVLEKNEIPDFMHYSILKGDNNCELESYLFTK